MRIGHGFDIHPLVEKRRLVLAGVDVPSAVGCAGHSDADVVLHAVADAILGAASLGDIGEWFPDCDPEYKNADSAVLLSKVIDKTSSMGIFISNLDVTIYLERPRLGPLKDAMRERLAQVCRVTLDRVGLKARTFEGFGAIGQGGAAAATAVVLLDDGDDKRG